MKKIFPIFLLFLTYATYGQLSFCPGSKGIPIFMENFGSGNTQGPALPAGTITYTYTTGMPHDGEYNLYYHTNLSSSWHNSLDHTPDTEPDGFEGKSLIINAGLTPGQFYRRVVNGLCVNTTFEFSAWIMNLLDITAGSCGGTGRPVDVTFEIWNSTETALIASGSTGPINGTATAIWTQYAITFTMPAGQTGVVLRMRNNGVGGCGNDLALDDISFSACGDVVTITSPSVVGSTYTSLCVDNNPVNIVLNANSVSTLPHVYQWQQSTDNVNWADIPGAVGPSYTTPNIISTRYYRTRVAEDAANLSNPLCSTLSDVFTVNFLPKPQPPVSNGDISICNNQPIPALVVTVGTGEHVNWYSAPTGGTLLAANTTTYAPATTGTYYAEAYTAPGCTSDTRTPVMLDIKTSVTLPADETIHLCSGQTAILDAGVAGLTYNWSPGGETTQTITVSGTGNYSVTATTADGCSDTRNFYVYSHEVPVIAGVQIDGTIVTVLTQGDSFYQYSLDGANFQDSNIFYNVHGGMYTVYVKDINNCGEDEYEFLLIFIPKFFTPNTDGYHDLFEIEGMAFLDDPKVAIFDRYGKLITMLTPARPTWDGNYHGRQLPSSDYWYLFTSKTAEYKEVKGHFSLKR
ncbi:T9SS type B sorting domain-containing protein [Flavobacterium sp.]|uniref:T9SS type B sorting domain-containing protein n=1 Tax=Flavobacterium sp. TaxID=239 RepID=UPI0039E47ADE